VRLQLVSTERTGVLGAAKTEQTQRCRGAAPSFWKAAPAGRQAREASAMAMTTALDDEGLLRVRRRRRQQH